MTSNIMGLLCEKINIIGLEDMNWQSDHKVVISQFMAPKKLKQALQAVQQRQMFDPRSIEQEEMEI